MAGFPALYDPFLLGDDRRLSATRPRRGITRVTAAHRAVIALHMSGWSTPQIAAHIQRPYSWVSSVLKDPLIREIINSLLAEVDDQLAALFPLAVATMKRVMETGSDGAAVKAAETVLKSQGKIKEGEGKAATAEDVVAQIMSRIEVDGKAIISFGMKSSRVPTLSEAEGIPQKEQDYIEDQGHDDYPADDN